MKKDTIEFETVPEHHSIRLPDGVPSGVPVRVVLMWEPVAATADRLKDLFASLAEGLTDADLITRRKAPAAVVMSLDSFNRLMETVHLLRSPANAEHLARSVDQYRRSEVQERGLIDG